MRPIPSLLQTVVRKLIYFLITISATLFLPISLSLSLSFLFKSRMALWVLHQACLGIAQISTFTFFDLDIVDTRIPTCHQAYILCVYICKHVISP